MGRSWAELPLDRAVRLSHAGAVTPPLEPLSEGMPAIITYYAGAASSAAEMVGGALRELESAAVELFPSWLPGAEGVDATTGAGRMAVRALALRLGSSTCHFGPFLADLAELSSAGPARGPSRFAPEVRVAGLATVLAGAFQRARAAILVQVPDGLSEVEEETLVAGCEWLACRGPFGVWLAGAPLRYAQRLETVTVHLPEGGELRPPPPPRGHAAAHTVRYPSVGGRPHPASRAEKAMEAALATRPWARGREWNQTYRSHPLVNPIRVDLLWRDERCVVEIDGPEHLAPEHHLADRLRDARLRQDGFAVLRFTNTQVLTDIETVVGLLERFLHGRRFGTLEGTGHG